MKKNLKDFKNNSKQPGGMPNFDPNNIPDLSNVDPQKVEEVQELYNQYSKLNQDQLQSELHKVIGEQKKSGTFDQQKLDQIASMLSPMFNKEQRNKLHNILGKLKE